MEAPEIAEWVKFLWAGGIGAAFLKLVEYLPSLFTGRAKQRRDDVDRMAAERDKANQEAQEARMRGNRDARDKRAAEEFASLLRRQLIEAPCVETDAIPPFPPYAADTGPSKIQKE